MGNHNFTPNGMRNSHSYPMSWFESSDIEPIIMVNINNNPVQTTTTKEVIKTNTGQELKDLLESIKDMTEKERRFAIKAHYGLLTVDDVESIL